MTHCIYIGKGVLSTRRDLYSMPFCLLQGGDLRSRLANIWGTVGSAYPGSGTGVVPGQCTSSGCKHPGSHLQSLAAAFLGPFVTRIRAEIPHSHRVVRICLLVKYCKTVLGIHSLSFGLQMQKLSQKYLGCLCRVMFIAIFVENGVRMCGAIDAEDALRTLFNSLLLYQPAPLDAFAPRRSSASDNGR